MSNQLISIPEYYARFIDAGVDLQKTPKVCCPFHKEELPSFSYSAEKGLWRCFGACKVGGDVVALHQKNYKLRTRREALDSLYKLLGITGQRCVERGVADLREAACKAAYAKAELVAKTPEDWDELDYLMGQYPLEVDKLEAFYNCRRREVGACRSR